MATKEWWQRVNWNDVYDRYRVGDDVWVYHSGHWIEGLIKRLTLGARGKIVVHSYDAKHGWDLTWPDVFQRRRMLTDEEYRNLRTANPIRSQAQWRKLAAMAKRGQIKKSEFRKLTAETETPFSKLPKRAPKRKGRKTRRKPVARKKRRTKNFASGMRYLRNLPPATRRLKEPRWRMANPAGLSRPLINLLKMVRHFAPKMLISGTTPIERRRLGWLSGHNYVRKGGPTGRVYYSLTEKGRNALKGASKSKNPARKRRKAPSRTASTRLGKCQKTVMRRLYRDDYLSDGARKKLTGDVREVLRGLQKRRLVKKSGTVGRNARWTLTTTGYRAVGASKK